MIVVLHYGTQSSRNKGEAGYAYNHKEYAENALIGSLWRHVAVANSSSCRYNKVNRYNILVKDRLIFIFIEPCFCSIWLHTCQENVQTRSNMNKHEEKETESHQSFHAVIDSQLFRY
jgi:hypothetical protein